MNLYDKVINDENLQVKIILPRDYENNNPSDSIDREDSVIRGYLENPFRVDTGAEWSDSLFGRDWSNKINQILGLAGTNIKAYTVLDTTQNYIAARIPSFQFSFYVISTNEYTNPMVKVNRLYEAIFPKKQSDITIQYHWGYKPNALAEGRSFTRNESPTKGTVIVTIGRWFRAFNMIITDVSIEYSDSVNPEGKPYWVKPTITLIPRRLPYVDEFIQMFNPYNTN
jgi:hypothetical protein